MPKKAKAQGGHRSKLAWLISEAGRSLRSLRYSKGTIENYATTWRSLLRFAERRRCDRFSDGLAEKFLKSRNVPLAGPAQGSNARHLRAAMRILSDIVRDGYPQRRRGSKDMVHLRPRMATALDSYSRYCVEQAGFSPATIRSRQNTVTRFLKLLETRGHRGLDVLAPGDIDAYFKSRSHLSTSTIGGETTGLRSFLRVGFALGFLPRDFSEYVPRVPWRKYGRLPSVWKPGEIDALLHAIDRSSPVGKRDYALLLFACRLGLRAGDIRALRLDDLHWDQAVLLVRQNKTDKIIELPMTDELATALIDYLRHGRPASEHRQVFLRLKAPFEPYDEMNNFYGIVTKYRRLAGIRLERERRAGLHSLRHSMATDLLASGVSVEQIAPILGHTSTTTTDLYTSVDVETLRSAALEPDGTSDA
jgi:site-specific recombinase XerD